MSEDEDDANIPQIPCMAVEHAVYSDIRTYLPSMYRNCPSLTPLQIIHMIFAWTSIISWLLFICDIALIAFLSMRAYRDGRFPHIPQSINTVLVANLNIVDSLEHYEVPFFGRLANSFVDDE